MSNATIWEGELLRTTQRTKCRASEALRALAGYPKAQPEGANHQSSSSSEGIVWQSNQLLTGEPKLTWVTLRNQRTCHFHQHRLDTRRNFFLKRIFKVAAWEMVKSPPLKVFKGTLDMALSTLG